MIKLNLGKISKEKEYEWACAEKAKFWNMLLIIVYGLLCRCADVPALPCLTANKVVTRKCKLANKYREG